VKKDHDFVLAIAKDGDLFNSLMTQLGLVVHEKVLDPFGVPSRARNPSVPAS
jgi:hypothetical protein